MHIVTQVYDRNIEAEMTLNAIPCDRNCQAGSKVCNVKANGELYSKKLVSASVCGLVLVNLFLK